MGWADEKKKYMKINIVFFSLCLLSFFLDDFHQSMLLLFLQQEAIVIIKR